MPSEGLWVSQGGWGGRGRTDSGWVLWDRFEPVLPHILPCIQPRILSHLLPDILVPSPVLTCVLPHFLPSILPCVLPRVLPRIRSCVLPHVLPHLPPRLFDPRPAPCPSCILPHASSHKGSCSLPDSVSWEQPPPAPAGHLCLRSPARAPGPPVGAGGAPPAPPRAHPSCTAEAGRLLNKLIRSGRGAGAERGPTVGLLEL